ncbi:MAG: hypothetical protein Q9P44_06745 [Anaerolineae bacterium]|nr:hypothetical protein [Anaerolineae bacterium]
MAKVPEQIPQEKLDLYVKFINTHPASEVKGGKKIRYTSLNGHMYTLLSKEGTVGLRLGKEQREAFIQKHNTNLCV